MIGKITAVLAKKEAEAYSSQGLHREAISLYAGLLSASPNIDPAIKAAIQSQIQGLSEEMKASDASKGVELSSEEIIRIRKGWGTRATKTDILVCAHSFYQIGAYADALDEFKHLLHTAGLKKNYVHGAADCLAHLHAPEALAEEIVGFSQEISSAPKAALAVQLAIAKHLAAGIHREHAAAMFHHLKRHPSFAPIAAEWLSRLAADKEATEASLVPAAKAVTMEPDRLSKSRFSLKRLGRLFRKKGGNRVDPDGESRSYREKSH